MTTLSVRNITSLSEYMGFVEQQSDTRWYRGCGDESYELIPSLYRHPEVQDVSSLLNTEVDILKRFKQRSIPYIGTDIKTDLRGSDNLSILFVMQHFGIPTRLLDWTENPYIGLYFSLSDAEYEKTLGGPEYKKNAAIWVLDPVKWNEKSLNVDPPPGIISPPHDYLNGHMPGNTTKLDPIALYGIYNSPRIVAQKGVFTLFGKSKIPMEQCYVENNYPQDCLIKIVIETKRIKDMIDGLIRIGITDSVIFPDLTGLSKEIKRFFKFWV